jgi:ParB family chromosome partitioning protein
MAERKDMYGLLFNEIVVEEGFNIRYDYGDIQELSNSIVENGITNPIHAYQKKGDINRYTLIEGHRRIRAVELAIKQGKLDAATFRIPMVKGKVVSDESRTLGLVLYNAGKALTLLEEAMVYERLINYGMAASEIAKKTGKSSTHISNCLRLCTANIATKKMIMDGTVAATLVSDLLKTKEPKDVELELKGAATEKKKEIAEQPAKKESKKEADSSDVPTKQDNTKTTGKNTQEMSENSGKAVKITKKDLKESKPKEIKYNREQLATILESFLAECKAFQSKNVPIELDINTWIEVNLD